jgi:VanZ family protein
MVKRLWARAAAWLAAAGLAVASWTPGDEMIRTGMNTHLEHAIAYLITGIAFIFGYTNWAVWKIATALLVYAGVLELGQLIVPGRHAGLLDYGWSAVGVLCAFASAQIIRRSANPLEPET